MSFVQHLRFLLGSGVFVLSVAGLPLAAQTVQQRLQPCDPTLLYRTRMSPHGLYRYLRPARSPAPRGVLLLLPAFGETAETYFRNCAGARGFSGRLRDRGADAK